MRIKFLGAAGTVTGSCYLLDNGKHKILVDCGMFQGSKEIKERNYQPFLFNPGEINFVLLTHAHIDHSGLIPKLYKHGFKGEVISTSATVDLCGVMLPDSAHIQETEVERKNRKNARAGRPLIEPIYTMDDAFGCLGSFRRIHYGQFHCLSPEITVRFQDAGHILGSSILEIWVKEDDREMKLVFSGDLGNYKQPLINDPTVIETADYVIMESTYGNRFHEERGNNLPLLKNVILETFAKGGNLIIPAFAIERTQDLLYDLSILVNRGEIKPKTVYIDSPLAISATEIFRMNKDNYFDKETGELFKQGINPLDFRGLTFTRTAQESQLINTISGGGNIIIAGSGMCEAGRIKHHLKHHLWKPESTVLFVGFQAEGTLGRKIMEGEKLVRIHGEEIKVRADIRSIPGFSAHADQTALVQWIKDFKEKPKKVFLVHGEAESAATLKDVMFKETGLDITIPKWQDEAVLSPTAEVKPSEVVYPEPNPAFEEVQGLYGKIQDKIKELVSRDLSQDNYADTLDHIRELKAQVDEILTKQQAS